MKNRTLKLLLVLNLMTVASLPVHATNNEVCSVLGMHQPDSNTYYGPTFCKNVVISDLTVRGPAEIISSQIYGKTYVNGPIKIISSTLQEVVLDSKLVQESIYLKSGSLINGNITFLGREGIVYIDGSSVIKGKITNGKVINN